MNLPTAHTSVSGAVGELVRQLPAVLSAHPVDATVYSLHAAVVTAAVCPSAPPGAQTATDQIIGYVLWGVIVLFGLSIITGIGAVVAGRMFALPHASKVGVISLVVVFVAAIGYLVLPGMLTGILGQGCV